MALVVNLQIVVNPGEALTDLELGILRAVGGSVYVQGTLESFGTEGSTTSDVEEPSGSSITPIKAKTPKAETGAKKPPVAEELPLEAPDPAAEDDDTPKPEEEVSPSGVTLGEAISKATSMISKGQKAAVREALEIVGVAKASQLKGKKIDAFMKALQD